MATARVERATVDEDTVSRVETEGHGEATTAVGALSDSLPRLGAGGRSWARPLIWSVFVLGLALNLTVDMGQVLLAMQARSAPIEVDDSYALILKAVQMGTCFRQDCPALEDLRLQLRPASFDPELAWVRYKEYGRAFLVYNPLYSALVALAHAIGLSWEASLKAVGLAGVVFIGLVFPYWLYALWGAGPAGLALGVLAFTDLHGIGLIPTHLALGIAMLVWARLVLTSGLAEWSLVLGSLAMVAMHPTGRLYAIASIALMVWLTRGTIWTWSRSVAVAASASIVAMSFLLPLVVDRPELRFSPDPPLPGWPESWYGALAYGLKRNLGNIDWIVKSWIELYGSLASVALITSVALLSLPPGKRAATLKNFAVLAGLLAISVLWILPRYPADLFQRAWIAMVVLLTGAVGQAGWIVLAGVAAHLAGRTRASSPLLRLRAGQSALAAPSNWIGVLAITIGIFVAVRMETGVVKGLGDLESGLASMRDEQAWALDPAQPKRLVAEAALSDIVLYIDEVPMHFYFTHGTLRMRAIYYPALVPPSEEIVLNPARRLDSPRMYRAVPPQVLAESSWLHSSDLRYVVGWSPVEQISRSEEAMVPLAPFSRIRYSSPEPVAVHALRLHLVNTGPAAELKVRYPAENPTSSVTLRVPAGWSGWLRGPTDPAGVAPRSFEVFARDAQARVYLKGIRSGEGDLNWPWGERGTLVFERRDKKASQAITFDPDALFPIRGLPVFAQVMNDSGSTVLARLVWRTGR